MNFFFFFSFSSFREKNYLRSVDHVHLLSRFNPLVVKQRWSTQSVSSTYYFGNLLSDKFLLYVLQSFIVEEEGTVKRGKQRGYSERLGVIKRIYCFFFL